MYEVFKTIAKLKEDISNKLKRGLRLLRLDNHKSKVIVAPTIGIDIAKYNGVKTKRKIQRKLNRMVVAVNKLLINSNEPGAKVPWISKRVHACKGNSAWSHKYKHLSDGCHFNASMKDFVVQEIAKCLTRM